MNPLKPARLRRGDAVAVLSPSWGGPSKYPHVYELGLKNLKSNFDVKVKEYSTARMSAEEVYANPRKRAEDLNAAFADPEVKAIIATIGGDDSVRILPFLDLPAILANPKILMGFSDTTTMTFYLNWNGLVTFNGPSILAGFAQMHRLPGAFAEYVRQVLMEPERSVEFTPYEQWSDKYRPWSTPGYDGELEELRPNTEGLKWLQGDGVVSGRLAGGCIEVLEFLKGTAFWPPVEFFDGKILFFETSEDKPPVNFVKYFLRNYGSMGAIERVRGILFGRARSYSDEEKEALYKMVVDVVAGEFGRGDMPIVANCDFGHTEPQWVMPLGALAEIDCITKRLRLLESPVL